MKHKKWESLHRVILPGMNFQSDWDIRLFNKRVSEVIAEWKERDDQGSARDVLWKLTGLLSR